MNQETESTDNNNAVQQCLVSNQNAKCAPKRPSDAKKYMVNCVRKNNKICYSDYQQLVVQDEICNSEVTDRQDFTEDSIYSGESLYKNLEFDQCQTEAENEKCLAFWKSVMEKNLQPIKCTLLKPSLNNRPLESHNDKRYKQKKKKGKAKSSKQQLGTTGQSSDEVNRKRDETFIRIFNELKKKKLDKLSLIVKQNCKTCELIDSMNKDVIYSGDQDLERKHNIDQLKTVKDGSKTESIASSLNIHDKQKLKREKGQQNEKMKKQEGKTNKKSSSRILNENVSNDKSTQDIISKADVETNTAEYLAKNPRCSCQTDLCVCKHDLAAVLQKMGKGPCCCGFAQCSCRENFYVNNKDVIPTDVGAAPTVSPASEVDDTATDHNSDNLEDKLKKTEIEHHKDSEIRAEYIPEENLAVKSITSHKQSLSRNELSESKTSKSNMIKSSNKHDHEGRKCTCMISKEPPTAKICENLKMEDDKLAKAKIKNDDSKIVAEYIPEDNQSKKSISSDVYLSSTKEQSGSKTSKLSIMKSNNEYDVEGRICRCMYSAENQTAKTDKNLKMENNKTEKIDIKNDKNSENGAEYIPDDNISKKSQSSKHSLSTTEHSGSRIYKLSSIMKPTDDENRTVTKESQSKISFNADEIKPRSACDLTESKQRDCDKREKSMEGTGPILSNQIKCRPKRSGSQPHHQSFSIPLTSIISDKDMSVPHSAEGNKCICDYNDCDCEKNIQPDNTNKDAFFEKGSKIDVHYTCSTLTKEKCECTFPNKGSKIDVNYTSCSITGLVKGKCECGYPDCDCEDSDMKFYRTKSHTCLCGCGHSLCKCKASMSISNILKKLEEEGSSSKLKISSKDSITKQNDGSKSSLCMCQTSKIYKQSSEMKDISEVKQQDSCECGFPDCDCKDFQSTENYSEEMKSKLEELDQKLKEAEIDYFEKTPIEERFISIGVQCENIDPVKVRERKYCLICGRYDCPCEVKRFMPDSNHYIMSM